VQEVIRMFVLKGYKYGEAKYEGRLYSTSQNPRRSTLRRTSVSRRGRRIRAADRESPLTRTHPSARCGALPSVSHNRLVHRR
jgi:hypothetical protein